MSYSVLLSAETEKNRESAYLYYLEKSPQGAHRWFAAYENAIASIAADPERFALAREAEHFSLQLRQINFGTKPSRPTHRLLYTVEQATIYVVTLRHLHQLDWGPTDSR